MTRASWGVQAQMKIQPETFLSRLDRKRAVWDLASKIRRDGCDSEGKLGHCSSKEHNRDKNLEKLNTFKTTQISPKSLSLYPWAEPDGSKVWPLPQLGSRYLAYDEYKNERKTEAKINHK